MPTQRSSLREDPVAHSVPETRAARFGAGLGAVAIAVALLGASCAVQGPGFDESSDSDTSAVKSMRKVLLCEQGLSDRVSDWDKGLFKLCQDAAAKGLTIIHDGKYPAFAALDENGAYEALFDTLDTNGDNRVDEKDTPTQVHLVGFSWGGINVTDVADRLRRDGRVATSRKGIAAMVLLDPFQPLVFHARIPQNVARAWEYRQTKTTQGDCSKLASLGFGFNGRTPQAKSASTECAVYDLDSFENNIGHCDVPVAAHDAAVVNLTQHQDYAPWDDHASDCVVK